jgi:hypothetical protein
MNMNTNVNMHVMYINLDRRPDRRACVEEELRAVGLVGDNVHRFAAIEAENGAEGCTQSHIKCLERAVCENWDYVLVCEDDIRFTDPGVFVNQVTRVLRTKIPWCVAMLGGNVIDPIIRLTGYCARIVGGCQTTTGYIVRQSYIPTLLDNMRRGLASLRQFPDRRSEFAIDRYWIPLQMQEVWVVLHPPTVTQHDGYSDIEKTHVSYTAPMLRSPREV